MQCFCLSVVVVTAAAVVVAVAMCRDGADSAVASSSCNCRICRCPILAKPAARPSALVIKLGTPHAWGAIVTIMIMLLLLLLLLLGVYHYDCF